MTPRRFIFVLVGAAIVAAVFFFFTKVACSPIPNQAPTKGSHGYRIWSGPTLKSFTHHGEHLCVPPGWRAVGATATGRGWAAYQDGMTGVIIRSSSFATADLSFTHSAYHVTLLYPVATGPDLLAALKATVTAAFEQEGPLFGDSATNTPRAHTVLVTAGVAGAPYSEDNAVYPDPGPNVTYFILRPDQVRGEEYLLHALMHLYNRHRPDLVAYEAFQAPIPAGDWQEMEATWAETAFRSSNEGRAARLAYLYNVHVAVRTHDFSLISEPPFSKDPRGFAKITQGVIVPDGATYLDDQYDHYVLSPLAMVAIEGLLQKYKTGMDMPRLLTELHAGTIKNFFNALGTYLPPTEIKNIQSWMAGQATIPHDLVIRGGHYYDH